MKKTLLFLNNTTNPVAVPPVLEQLLDAELGIDSRWAAQSEFPGDLDCYAGAFVSGSPSSSYDREPWIEREHEVIAELVRLGTPVMGICFGSQILASSLFGRDQVFRRASCEVGYTWLDMAPGTACDPLCRDTGSRMRMFVWHNDDVRSDHDDMVVMATSEDCANHIWRHRTSPVWGVQGHLEITPDDAPRWFSRNRERLEADGADVDSLVAAPEETAASESMLRSFVEICSGSTPVSGDRNVAV